MLRRTKHGARARAHAFLACLTTCGAFTLGTLPSLSALAQDPVPEDEEESLIEFHFRPVPNAQIAIWVETESEEHYADVFVTQAVGKLGIANRPGIWNFLSSWRAPYGPRRNALPVWAHRRGKTYPTVVFNDPKKIPYWSSLGWHETTSSFESYFCKPLSLEEHTIALDVLSCPSPQIFQSDKGRFVEAVTDPEDPESQVPLTSVYPPRNDLVMFEDGADSADTQVYAQVNDLDAVTGPTPPGQFTELATLRIPRSAAEQGPMVAWIEIHLEHDENADWDFDRETDHFVDYMLESYGIEFLGQPSVVYRVEFDPMEEDAFFATDVYRGYGDWDGASGTIHDPDGTISNSEGSGADRLQPFPFGGGEARFGVFSHGLEASAGGSGSGTDGGDTGGDSGGGGGGGACQHDGLPPVENLRVEATEFDRIKATFRFPELPEGVELTRVRAHWVTPEDADFSLDSAKEAVNLPQVCRYPNQQDCLDPTPGKDVSITVDQLFGNYSYKIGLTLRDLCNFDSETVTGTATTPNQEFQTIDSFCVVSTAAYGAAWEAPVASLRSFRDRILARFVVGEAMIQSYYAYGPSLVPLVRSSDAARATTRELLNPFAALVAPLRVLGGGDEWTAP